MKFLWKLKAQWKLKADINEVIHFFKKRKIKIFIKRFLLLAVMISFRLNLKFDNLIACFRFFVAGCVLLRQKTWKANINLLTLGIFLLCGLFVPYKLDQFDILELRESQINIK